MQKRSIALALCCCLVCSPVWATTFIGVLWPLFGPLAAPGLAELVAELQSMPDVEVITYWHPEWPSLVDDINHQSAGTHILVIGYSLGANNAVLVANNTNYIDSIIALNLVKSEIARLSAEQLPNTAQAQMARAFHPTKPPNSPE